MRVEVIDLELAHRMRVRLSYCMTPFPGVVAQKYSV